MVEVFFVQPAGYSGVRAASPSLLTFEASDTLGALAAGDPNPSIDKWAGQFEGSGTGIAAAPGGTGSTLSQALQINKGNTNAWSGLNLVDYTDSDVKVTDGTHHVVTMNYFSPDTATSPVELQLLGTNTLSQCVDAAPGWNSLSFDFSTVSGWSDSNEYTKLVLFPNFKDNCANKGSFSTPASLTNQLYYIDNVNVNSYAAPANTVAPTVSGTLKVGKTVTANVGTWSGAAGTTTYKWYACKVKKTTAAASVTSAAKCSAISGGTSATLKLKSAQKGKYLRVLITQTNALGSATKLSKTFGKVK
jgi:hypothetical protein